VITRMKDCRVLGFTEVDRVGAIAALESAERLFTEEIDRIVDEARAREAASKISGDAKEDHARVIVSVVTALVEHRRVLCDIRGALK